MAAARHAGLGGCLGAGHMVELWFGIGALLQYFAGSFTTLPQLLLLIYVKPEDLSEIKA